MKASELVAALTAAIEKHGDIGVCFEHPDCGRPVEADGLLIVSGDGEGCGPYCLITTDEPC